MSARRSRKALLIPLAAAAVLIGIIFLFFSTDSGINEKNLALIRSYGWEVREKPEEIIRLTIPEEFDVVCQTYDAIAKAAGFDFAAHKGAHATRYAYLVLNHKDSATAQIRADVFVTKDGIIAADICSLSAGGFLQPICDISGQIPAAASHSSYPD